MNLPPALRWSCKKARAGCGCACRTASRIYSCRFAHRAKCGTFEGGAGAQLDQLTEIQNAVAGQVKATVRHTIDKVLFENKSDVFRYSEFICKYLPDYWKANQQRWEQVIDDCTVDISVDCIIDHPGLETSHRHP